MVLGVQTQKAPPRASWWGWCSVLLHPPILGQVILHYAHHIGQGLAGLCLAVEPALRKLALPQPASGSDVPAFLIPQLNEDAPALLQSEGITALTDADGDVGCVFVEAGVSQGDIHPIDYSFRLGGCHCVFGLG
jgi:hypothetical protein